MSKSKRRRTSLPPGSFVVRGEITEVHVECAAEEKKWQQRTIVGVVVLGQNLRVRKKGR